MLGVILMSIGMAVTGMDGLPEWVKAAGVSVWMFGLMLFGDERWKK